MISATSRASVNGPLCTQQRSEILTVDEVGSAQCYFQPRAFYLYNQFASSRLLRIGSITGPGLDGSTRKLRCE